jgi:hypothetical protein
MLAPSCTSRVPRHHARLIFTTIFASVLLVAPAAARTGLKPEAIMLSAMDFPEGKPIFSGSAEKDRVAQRWAEAVAVGPFVPIHESVNREKGWIVRWTASHPRPVPEVAVQRMAKLQGTDNAGDYYDVWIKSSSEPQADATQRPSGTGAYRLVIRCMPATVVQAASIFWHSSDGSGVPSSVFADYNYPQVSVGPEVAEHGYLQAAYMHVCSGRPEAAAMQQRSDLFKLAQVQAAAAAAAVNRGEKLAPARLRMFGSNGSMARLTKRSACAGGANEVTVSDPLLQQFASLGGLRTVSNVSLEMPQTKASRSEQGTSGWKGFYQEHEVPSGEPTTITLGMLGCAPMAASFIPVPGEDYESSIELDTSSNRCLLTVGKIATDSSLHPVAVTKASWCPNQ